MIAFEILRKYSKLKPENKLSSNKYNIRKTLTEYIQFKLQRCKFLDDFTECYYNYFYAYRYYNKHYDAFNKNDIKINSLFNKNDYLKLSKPKIILDNHKSKDFYRYTLLKDKIKKEDKEILNV